MHVAEGVILRASIVLGMLAAVLTVIYLSPMPDQFFRSCDRPCNDLDWPMICRVQITIDANKIKRGDCEDQADCANSTESLITGYSSTNNLMAGPSIQVCQNDVLIIDVVNKLPGRGVTLHWRGQPQVEAPYMDGAPMITQCPISSYTTFQYKFRASAAGTHLWHAHSGTELAQGVFGALIVRRAGKLDPQRKLYDVDKKEHLILISESTGNLNSPPKLIINGHINESEIYSIKRGRRHRFRMAYGSGLTNCPVTLTIEEHLMKIVSLDGIPTSPVEVHSITLAKGERADFILKGNKDKDRYRIKIKSHCDYKLEGTAILAYMQSTNHGNLIIKPIDEFAKHREFTTSLCDSKNGQFCLENMNSLKKLPTILKYEVDRQIFLPFDYKTFQTGRGNKKIYTMNNITFTYPSSPLLTQLKEVPNEIICNALDAEKKCNDQNVCECVHVEEIPMGSSVELLFIDQGGDAAENIFHLHGYSFYVMASKTFDKPMTLQEVKSLDEKDMLFKRNNLAPIQKDTIRIPRYSVVALRFLANNPGFWLLRDSKANQWTRGMDMVFRVGTLVDLPTVPTSFPTCGSWVGPQFFLI